MRRMYQVEHGWWLYYHGVSYMHVLAPLPFHL